MFRINKEVKIFFNYVIGPLLGAWLFYSLYKEIKAQPNLEYSISEIRKAAFTNNLWPMILVVFMVFVNWGIESRKWQLLVKMIQPISYYMAVKGVLSGVALSINTPNRVGEYGGRILFINEGNRLKAISLSMAGSLSQLIITLLMGGIGVFYLLFTISAGTESIIGLSIFWVKILLYVSFLFGALFSILFLRLSSVFKMIDRIPVLAKYKFFVETLERFDANLLLRLISLSFFRYLVFVIQYIVLMTVFGVHTTIFQAFWAISVLYLVLAIVPSIAIAELGIRGKFSVALLSLYTSNYIGIMGSTFGIWFLNLFIPAITGSIFILSNKFFKDNSDQV